MQPKFSCVGSPPQRSPLCKPISIIYLMIILHSQPLDFSNFLLSHAIYVTIIMGLKISWSLVIVLLPKSYLQIDTISYITFWSYNSSMLQLNKKYNAYLQVLPRGILCPLCGFWILLSSQHWAPMELKVVYHEEFKSPTIIKFKMVHEKANIFGGLMMAKNCKTVFLNMIALGQIESNHFRQR